ncbi:MAG: DUF2232 domain-containing protein [Bradyrhizobiaceae bacterium]|nr:MAG: DUF2232 domain-containing protein [Bradyrhizobiaceae bacterium]
MTGILIALAAGLASALMFASITSGVLISLLLFYLAPLPLMVAALGWGSMICAIGGLVAALGIGAIFGFTYMIAFALTVALPAWWLGHLSLLARTVPGESQSGTAALDWYPVGRILVWLAAFASLTTLGAMLALGTDSASINAALRAALERIVSLSAPDATTENISRVVEALVSIAPGAATLIAMLTLTLSLWLAAKITSTSQRLKRPWPDLRATTLPPLTLAALAAAIALCFAGGMIAIISQIVCAALLTAYGLIGFAVAHVVSQAFPARTFMLGLLYATTLFIGWPLIGAIGLGLTDAAFGLRERYWRKQGAMPPT